MHLSGTPQAGSQPPATASEATETVIIGGGQAGVAAGYHLTKRDQRFVILDANPRIGDAWRQR